MFYLKNDAACTINFFFQNDMFCILDLFILLLKQTYDDMSCKHNAATKLEEFWQQNYKFTSFFSEFLNLVEKFKWNETAKINAFRQKISNKVQTQLINCDLLNILSEFVTLCQQINEDIYFADAIWFWRNLTSQLTNSTAQTVCFSKNLISAKKLINIDNKNIQQYIFIKFNK